MYKSLRSTSLILVIVFFINLVIYPNYAYAISFENIVGQAAANSTSPNFIEKLFWEFLSNTPFSQLFNENINNTPKALPTYTKRKEIIGFYAEWWGADTSSFQSLKRNAETIDTIAPFWATLKEDGSVIDRGGNDHPAVVKFAHQNNISVLLLLNNEKSPTTNPSIRSILSSQTLRRKSIDNIENYIKKYKLDGINIDFEMVPPDSKDTLTQFMEELYSRLHPQGYLVTIDVFPKENEFNDVSIAYDYLQLAKYTDKIVLMTYDNHGTWSKEGPIADISWVERNLKYALKFIPKDKLFLGIAAYGYDWYEDKVDSLNFSRIMDLSKKYNAPILWDEPSKSPYLSYTDHLGIKHSIWFENKQSLEYKLNLIQKYDVAGAAVWKLGEEDPDYWKIFKNKFT